MNEFQEIVADRSGFQTWLSVARACHIFERALGQELAPLGIEVPHYDVLANVVRDEGLSQQVLARRLFVAKSNVSTLLAGLERRKLIRREKHDSDKRIRRVFLTEEGRALARRAMTIHAALTGAMMADCNPKDSAVVLAAMQRCAANLQARGAAHKAKD